MKILRTLLLLTAAFLVGFLWPLPAGATPATFTDPGPIDLSGSDHPTGNAGEHVELGSVDVPEGDWLIHASVLLFVPDHGTTKNSQGCGIYVDGVQVGGAGGSSSLWEPADGGGKQVILDTFLVPPDWTSSHVIVTGPATIIIECFIDQSHGGATLDQREGMEARDVSILAQKIVEPTDPTSTDQTCEQPGTITLAPDEGIDWLIDNDGFEPGTFAVAPGDHTVAAAAQDGYVFDPTLYPEGDPTWPVTVQPSIEACPGPAGPEGLQGERGEPGENSEDSDTPAAVPTAVPAGLDSLPKTGPDATTLGIVGAAVLLSGAAAMLLGRRRFNK